MSLSLLAVSSHTVFRPTIATVDGAFLGEGRIDREQSSQFCLRIGLMLRTNALCGRVWLHGIALPIYVCKPSPRAGNRTFDVLGRLFGNNARLPSIPVPSACDHQIDGQRFSAHPINRGFVLGTQGFRLLRCGIPFGLVLKNGVQDGAFGGHLRFVGW